MRKVVARFGLIAIKIQFAFNELATLKWKFVFSEHFYNLLGHKIPWVVNVFVSYLYNYTSV